MYFYFICAERSGDKHAAALLQELKKIYPNARFRAVGGEFLQKAGANLFINYQEINYMGVWEVLKNARTLLKKIDAIASDIISQKPTVVIHIDASSLNIRIAKRLLAHPFKRVYYIAPKIWAWNTGRVKTIKKLFDKLFVIFPFEVDFYKKHGVVAVYAGNPTWESVAALAGNEANTEKAYIALLPGSRIQEITTTLPLYTQLAEKHPELSFVIAGISALPPHVYAPASGIGNIDICWDNSFAVLQGATAAAVVSGTATFEAALLNVPQVVVYKTSWLTYWVVKMIIQVPYISLVNLVADKEVVRELIQDAFSLSNLEKELIDILPGAPGRQRVMQGYAAIKETLGPTHASERAAAEIASYLGQE